MFKKIAIASFVFLSSITSAAAGNAKQENITLNQSFYDFSFTSIDGTSLPVSNFKGKVVLVINTASRCGFTKQYDGLQKLYENYADKGLVIIGVPSNDFMGQEPGTNQQIKEFCETRFGITFPMTEKEKVKGNEAHPFFKWAAEQDHGGVPGWNFHKFLISKDGRLIDSFGSTTDPYDKKIIDSIEKAL